MKVYPTKQKTTNIDDSIYNLCKGITYGSCCCIIICTSILILIKIIIVEDNLSESNSGNLSEFNS